MIDKIIQEKSLETEKVNHSNNNNSNDNNNNNNNNNNSNSDDIKINFEKLEKAAQKIYNFSYSLKS